MKNNRTLKRAIQLIAAFVVTTTISTLTIAQNGSLSPYLWYKADNVLNTSSEIHDYSGNIHFAKCTDGFTISDSGMVNFNKAFVFDNSDVDLRIKDIPSSNSRLTIFCVYTCEDADIDQFVWTVFFDSTSVAGLTTKRLKTFMMDKEYEDSTGSSVVLNATSIGWLNMTTDTTTNYISIGNRDSVNLVGKMAEFILFNRELDTAERLLVQSYLALKYGTTLFESDYIDSKGRILWDYDENIQYKQEIAGIGKDTVTGLFQKQSAGDGGENLLCIGAGTIGESNLMNAYDIATDDFLVWSSNNAALDVLQAGANDDYEISNLSSKQWLIQVTGESARQIPTQLTLRADSIDFDGKCYLVIDQSGNADFTMENCELVKSDSIDSNNKVFFSGIKWDTDSSSKDVFTFLFGNKLTLLATGSPDGESDKGKIKLEVIGGIKPFGYKLTQMETGDTWQWNSQSRNQTRNNLPYGEYMAKVTDRGGEVDSMMVLISGNRSMIVQTPATGNKDSGVENTSMFMNTELFPNPTNGEYSIQVKLTEATDLKMRILDRTGKEIETQMKTGSNQYEFEGLIGASGVYCVELCTESETKTVKLVVQ